MTYSVFERQIEPNEHLNAASRLIAEPRRALKALRQVESTSMKNRFLSNPYYQECVETLAARDTLSRGDAVNVQRKLVELNTLSHVFTRTKKKDIDIKFPTREARVVTVDFAHDEMDFYNAVTKFVEDALQGRVGVQSRYLVRTNHAAATGRQLHPRDASIPQVPGGEFNAPES